MTYEINRGITRTKNKTKAVISALSLGVAGVLAAAAMALPALAASAFQNGSFENGTDPGSFTTLTAPDAATITGWTVSSGTIDYIGTYWTASDGVRSLDLSGTSPGAISQTFNTVTGHNYTVTFDMAGNPDGTPIVKTMTVDAGGTPQTYSFDTSTVSGTASHTNMGWTPKTFNFTATGPTTTLTFTSTTATSYGPALDNVRLTDNTQQNNQNTVVKIRNNNHIHVNNTNTQNATTGNARVIDNTTGGSATSGAASNTNSSTTSFSVTNTSTVTTGP
jgi:choice-of-anchor C domain-containing protein